MVTSNIIRIEKPAVLGADVVSRFLDRRRISLIEPDYAHLAII